MQSSTQSSIQPSLASLPPFPLNPLVPEHTKVMGKEWADARRAANVARLAATLSAALAGQTDITFELGCGHGHWLAPTPPRIPANSAWAST